jgi:hypothetical protein
MGRDRRRNEDDLLELECLPNLFRPPEVTQMNGVESPPKKTNPPARRLLFDLSTLLSLVTRMAHSAKRIA